MKTSLIELEQEGIKLLNTGAFKEASEIFTQLINEQPYYEHGICFYDLACCFEEMGDLESAEKNYLRAIEYAPDDTIRLGGYASFLYLYGETHQAFEVYQRLLDLERARGQATDAENTILALKALGKRMGLSDQDITQKTGTVGRTQR